MRETRVKHRGIGKKAELFFAVDVLLTKSMVSEFQSCTLQV